MERNVSLHRLTLLQPVPLTEGRITVEMC